MTSEELEREIKRLEEQIEDQINSLRIKFLESEANKKLYEEEVPEDLENYFYVDETGIIYKLSVYVESEQIKILNRGLAFKTEEEAERYDKERILINRAKDWVKKYNGGWTPDLKDYNERKYYVEWNSYYEPLGCNYCRTLNLFSKLPYFKSEEIAEQFIKEFGDEIKEVFC